jgi:lactoylglutathione lyase
VSISGALDRLPGMFTSTFPILSTRDLGRALGFYRDLLDGKVSYEFGPSGSPVYVSLEIGSSSVGLGFSPDAPSGAGRVALWVYAVDCDAAVARLRAAGVPIVEEPMSQPWGERTARVLDPDGNEVVIGSPARPDTDPAQPR